nr:hypothetical protein 7 [Pelagibacterales bacterium]
MKIDYPGNDKHFIAQYHRVREGPNGFLIYYKNSSVLRQDPKDAWRVLGKAKFTQSAQHFKEWCLEMDKKYNKSDKKEEEGRADTSFASDAINEESDPTANTKMVT